MSEPFPDRAALEHWLVAARGAIGAAEEMNLGVLTSEDLTIVAADVEGIQEACEDVATRIRALIEEVPSAEALEDALIAADLSLNHAMWHWKSIRGRLLTHGLWDHALIDEDESSNER